MHAVRCRLLLQRGRCNGIRVWNTITLARDLSVIRHRDGWRSAVQRRAVTRAHTPAELATSLFGRSCSCRRKTDNYLDEAAPVETHLVAPWLWHRGRREFCVESLTKLTQNLSSAWLGLVISCATHRFMWEYFYLLNEVDIGQNLPMYIKPPVLDLYTTPGNRPPCSGLPGSFAKPLEDDDMW